MRTVRSNHPFHKALTAVRKGSRWSSQPTFSRQIGLSQSSYAKYETGRIIPSAGVLKQIVEFSYVEPKTAAQLWELWNDAKAVQAGLVGPTRQTPKVDCDSLARRIGTEVVYVLKRAGVHVKEQTQGVVTRRISMILKSALEDTR